MKNQIICILLLLILVGCKRKTINSKTNTLKQQTYIKLGFKDNMISPIWIDALKTRQSEEYLDSIQQITRPLSKGENEWKEIIESRLEYWSSIKDSIKVPFGTTFINDTTYVLLGYTGYDDGFTYKYKTVCFDITALNREYGSANDSINTNRMDRIFAHEYTHLLHKEWAKQNDLKLETYKDSILWECFYEGLGVYRSMSKKWFPVDDSLSKTSEETFKTLYPIFTDRLIIIDSSALLSKQDKIKLHKNLSRGSMKKKWGALPVGVWLALEANGNHKNLRKWVDEGPNAIIPLAKKYLTGSDETKFLEYFKDIE